MSPSFSDADIGKTVANATGMAVGTIASVEDDTAYVDPDPSVTDAVKAALGWETDPENPIPLEENAVSEITDDTIYIADDRSATNGSDENTKDTTVKREVSTGQRDMGPTTTELDETTDDSSEDSAEESGAERHPDTEDAPPDGEKTVTKKRGANEDR